MESSLHRQLKALYAGPDAACEIRVDGYRIDAVVDGLLIEVQQASLAALRTKVSRLLERHRVLVVKPLVTHKTIVRLDRRTGERQSVRRSPAQQSIWDLFTDLVHFTSVFPHPNLTLEVVLAEIEEHRVAARSRAGYRVADRVLTAVAAQRRFQRAADLCAFLPAELPPEFTTQELAALLDLPRWWAQQVAYCLRKTGAVQTLGKRRRAWLYRRAG